MSYAASCRTRSKPLLLASALDAYAILFPAGKTDKRNPLSAQFPARGELL
jgi:hypothetical protein